MFSFNIVQSIRLCQCENQFTFGLTFITVIVIMSTQNPCRLLFLLRKYHATNFIDECNILHNNCINNIYIIQKHNRETFYNRRRHTNIIYNKAGRDIQYDILYFLCFFKSHPKQTKENRFIYIVISLKK